MCCNNGKMEFPQLLQEILLMIIRHTHEEKKYKQKKYLLSFPSMPTASIKKPIPNFCVGLLSTTSATVKVHTIHKTFLLTIPSVKKPKFGTHPKYLVINLYILRALVTLCVIRTYTRSNNIHHTTRDKIPIIGTTLATKTIWKVTRTYTETKHKTIIVSKKYSALTITYHGIF